MTLTIVVSCVCIIEICTCIGKPLHTKLFIFKVKSVHVIGVFINVPKQSL
mgnify:CR=1 FL=1